MKKVLLIFVAFLLLLPLGMKAQTEVNIVLGDSTSTSATFYSPFNNYYKYSYNEMIYTSDMFPSGCNISSISWYVNNYAAVTADSLRIYMGTTTRTEHSTNRDWQLLNNLTLVYAHDNVPLATGTGWSEFTLDQPFLYDGEKNLVIVVAKKASTTSDNLKFKYVSTENACMYRQNDQVVDFFYYPGTTNTGSKSAYLPVVKLNGIQYFPPCPAPDNVVVAGVTESTATLTWEAGGSESSWDIILSTTDITPDATTSVSFTSTSPTYIFTNLVSTSQYYAYVRANCGAGDVSNWRRVTFMTSQNPASFPYTQNWENETENAQWIISNGSQTNKWYIGTGANNTEGGTQALYVSNNQGTSPNYTITSASNVWAYRDINFGPYVNYQLSFDFKGVGEYGSDYLELYIGPPAFPSGNTPPAGATYLGQISGYDDFVRATFTFNASFSGVQRLYLLWHNDSFGGTNPPAIVDNISIEGSNCGRPNDLVLDSITIGSFAFHFTPATSTDNTWEAVILAPGDTINDDMIITLYDTAYEFTGLEANTLYTVYVRTHCGSETSYWSEALQGRTDCPDYLTIPYSEDFDTYGTGSSSYPVCWERMSTYSTGDYPYIHSTNYSAPGSLCFYASSATNNMIVMPALDPTVFINNLSVSFMFRAEGTTSGYALEVGVVENSDASTFTHVKTITAETANEWEEVEVIFAEYAGSGTQIAFRWTPDAYNSCYVDNVNVYYTPSCLKPLDVVATNITANIAQIGWEARNSESSWQIVVVPSGEDLSMGTPETVYSNPYYVSDLSDSSQYDVYVKALCGEDSESDWSSPYTFRTKCFPTLDIPYVEDFSGYGAGDTTCFPSCWTRHQEGTTTTYPYITITDGASLYFYSSPTVMSYGATHPLDLSIETPGSLVLSFDLYKTSSSEGRMDVGYMTDADDLSTFHLIETIYPEDMENTSTWYHFEALVPAAAYTSNVYFAFKAPMGGSNNLSLDNVKVDYGTVCPAPENLVVSNVTGSSALVSWTPADGVTEYVLEYTASGQNSGNIQIVAGNSVMLSGLNSTTDYEVMLYYSCETESSDTLTAAFSTSCLVNSSIAIGEGIMTNSYIPSYSSYNYSYCQQIFLASEMNGATQLRSISLEGGSLITPRNIKIYLMHTSVSNASYWLSATSAQLVYSGPIAMASGWSTYNFTTPFQYNGTDNLVLIIIDETGTYYEGNTWMVHTAFSNATRYIFQSGTPYSITSEPSFGVNSSYRNNVIFGGDCDTTAACVEPNVYVVSVDSSSAEIAWAPGFNEISWALEYKLSTEETWTSEAVVTTSPYIFSGLASGTDYDVRLRSVCDEGEYSDWVTTSFSTICYVTELPFVENFDNPYTGSTNYDSFLDCWNRKTNYSSQHPYCSSTYHNSGTHSLYFSGSSTNYSLAATPRFSDSILMNRLQIQFMAYMSSAGYFIEVGIMSDPNDPNTFTLIDQVSPSSTNIWERFEINTADYSGNGHYIAFRVPQWAENNIYIDDVNINYIPSCLHVENIEAYNITAHTADIAWDAGASEGTWGVLYGTHVDVDVDQPIMVTTNSIALTNLLANTEYTVYVKAMCDNGQSSSWMSYTFRTKCEALTTLPFFEDFESHTGGSTSNNVLPYCWSMINTGTSAIGCPTVNTNSSYAYSGSNVLFFYSSSAADYGDQYAILPEFDTDVFAINTLRLSLYARRYGSLSSYQNFVVVGVMTDNTDASTFTPVDTVTFTSTTIARHDVDFTNYVGTGGFIAIKVPQPAGSYSHTYIYLDDIAISLSPMCDTPTDLTATVNSASEVSITWDAEETENSWEFLMIPDTETPDFTQAQTVNSNNQTISNLAGNTTYLVYVRTVCSNSNGYSEWVNTSFVTPSNNPAQLPYYNGFEDVDENAEWEIRNNATGNKWYIGTPIGATDNRLYVSGDNGFSTSYNVNSASTVWAYRDIQFPQAAEFELRFKWAAVGESCCDYMYAYLGDPIDVAASTDYVEQPEGSEQIGGRFNMNTTGSWFTQTLDASLSGSVKRLYFVWYNDGSQGTPPAISIDSIIITSSDCARPYDLEADNILSYSAEVSFSPSAETDVAWDYVLTTGTNPDDPALTPISISSTLIQLSNLIPDTTYRVYVRTDCGGEYSGWCITPAVFTTLMDCPAPTNITATNITQTSAVISWTEPATAIEWELEYGEAGFTQGTGTIVTVTGTPTYTISDLTSFTTYDVYVTAICSETESSVAAIDSFTTSCEPIALPYSEDFDSYTGTNYNTPGVIPDCWNNYSNNTSYPAPHITGSGYYNYPHSGTNALTFTAGSAGADAIAILPEFSAVLNHLELSFYYRMENATHGTLVVGYVTDVDNPASSFVSVEEINNTTTITNHETSFADFTDVPAGARIAFKWTHNTSFYSCSIDDILVEDATVCDVPTDLTVSNVSQTGAVATWTAGGDEAAWNVQYKEASASAWGNSISVTEATYTFSGLTDSTAYQVRVQAVCDSTTSDWTEAVNFTTLEEEIPDGISNYDLDKSVSLYPNPTSDRVTISAQGMMESVSMYDVYGKLISTMKVNDTNATVDLSSYASGVYFARITTENGVVTKRIVKK